MAYIITCPKKAKTEDECRRNFDAVVEAGYTGTYAQFKAQCCDIQEEPEPEPPPPPGPTPPDIPEPPIPDSLEGGVSIQQAQDWIGQVVNGIIEGIGNISGTIGGWAEDAIGGINKAFDGMVELGGEIVGGIKQSIDGIGGVIRNVLDEIKRWLGDILDWIADQISNVIDGIADLIEDIYNNIAEWIEHVIQTARDFIEGVIVWATEELAKLWEAIEKGFQSFVDWLTETINTIMEWVNERFKDTISGIQKTINQVEEWFDRTIEEVRDFIGSIATAIADTILLGFNTLVDYLKEVVATVGRELSGFGDIDTTQFENLMIWLAKIQLRASERIAQEVLESDSPEPPPIPPFLTTPPIG